MPEGKGILTFVSNGNDTFDRNFPRFFHAVEKADKGVVFFATRGYLSLRPNHETMIERVNIWTEFIGIICFFPITGEIKIGIEGKFLISGIFSKDYLTRNERKLLIKILH